MRLSHARRQIRNAKGPDALERRGLTSPCADPEPRAPRVSLSDPHPRVVRPRRTISPGQHASILAGRHSKVGC
jgi:hypothetical protein